MGPDQMFALLHTEPFRPLRVTLNNGKVYDITDPYMNLISMQIFELGIPDPYMKGRAIDSIWIQWPDIASVEPIA